MPDRFVRRGARSLVAAVALGIAAPTSHAQQPGQVDAGTFEHRIGDGYAGTETFAVRRRGDDVVAVGRVTREGGPEALRAIEVGLRVDPGVRPLRYELRTREGSRLHIVVSRTGLRLRSTTSSEEGERFTEYLAHDDLLIVEREIAHHYGLLARRLVAASDPRVLELEVLVPAEGRKVACRVEAQAEDTLALGDRSVVTTRYELIIGDERTAVWVGRERGRVLRVAIAGRGWSATRQPVD